MKLLLSLLILLSNIQLLQLESITLEQLIQVEQPKGFKLYRNTGLGVSLSTDLYSNANMYSFDVINGELKSSDGIEVETEYFIDKKTQFVKFISYTLSPISTVLNEVLDKKIEDEKVIEKMFKDEGKSDVYQEKINQLMNLIQKELSEFEQYDSSTSTRLKSKKYKQGLVQVTVNSMLEESYVSKIKVYVSFN
jgi:hypothetical protein